MAWSQIVAILHEPDLALFSCFQASKVHESISGKKLSA